MAAKASAKKGKTVEFASNKAGLQVTVGDVVLVHPQRKSELPYIARIDAIEEGPHEGDFTMQCRWYYRPTETPGGRQLWQGKQEVFLSDHMDSIFMSNVLHKVQVHGLQEYCSLRSRDPQRDFFSRLRFKAAINLFEPLSIPVFCQCAQPFNPDLAMVCCGTCDEWFHVQCVGGISEAKLQEATSFTCPHCKQRGK